jgi:hypothetical protein
MRNNLAWPGSAESGPVPRCAAWSGVARQDKAGTRTFARVCGILARPAVAGRGAVGRHLARQHEANSAFLDNTSKAEIS